MSSTANIGAFIVSFVVTMGPLQQRGWRGIVPLHSTREDVERLVGPPMMPDGISYDLITDRLNVVYSSVGSCREGGAQWDVPRGTVIGITVYPQTRLMLSDLSVDLNRFEKFSDPHVADRISYNNNEDGIAIAATLNGEVISIQLFPAAKNNHLRCAAAPHGGPARKFDEYSNLPFSDEKARLDNFAIYLQKDEPAFKGYIFVFTGPRARPSAAQAHAKRARDYLVKVRGINAARIVTIYGGCRDKLEVELYALPSSMAPPAPNPVRNVQCMNKTHRRS